MRKDPFHIVSAHAPNCLVSRYLRDITRKVRLPMHSTVEYGKDEKKKKFANKIRLMVKMKWLI